jgi:hypothetical protein
MKKVIYFVLTFFFCSSLYAQQNVCVGTNTSFSVNGSFQTSWKLSNTVTGVQINDDSGTLLRSGSPISWDVRCTACNNVQVRINNVNTTRFFKVSWATYNWWGAYIKSGDIFITVPPTIVAPTTAPIDFPGTTTPLTANCGIRIGVTNPQSDVTYTWSNGQIGQTVIYNGFNIPASCGATSTCQSAPVPSTNVGTPPGPNFPDPIISIPSNVTVCVDQSFSVSAKTVVGCVGSSWNWSSNPLFVSNNTGTGLGGSTAFYSFNSAGTFSVNVSGTSTLPPFATVQSNSSTITVLPGGGFCAFLKGGGSNTESAALKVRSNTPKGSATLFPNPVSEVLQLKELQDYDNLRVVDQYGKVLNTQPIVEGETAKSLNVSQFANGLYLIQFTNKTGELTTKKFQVLH